MWERITKCQKSVVRTPTALISFRGSSAIKVALSTASKGWTNEA